DAQRGLGGQQCGDGVRGRGPGGEVAAEGGAVADRGGGELRDRGRQRGQVAGELFGDAGERVQSGDGDRGRGTAHRGAGGDEPGQVHQHRVVSPGAAFDQQVGAAVDRAAG